jgi:predicted alpha/beta superfamily hydrolase
MKTLVSLLLLFSISLTFGQETIYKEYSSEILNDTRDLSIYLPKGYNKDSISNFPLAIVLDGHKLFDLYVGASNYYAQLDHAPEQIVVGIDMKDSRNKDAGYDVNNGNLDNNSENFYRFIRDEMIPYIEATFKTSPFLTIVGESLTANYITHFLKEEYSIFNAYICLNPTLSNTINNQVESYRLKELSSEDNTFYFYLSSNPFSNTIKKDKIKNFGKFIKSFEIDNFNVVFDELTNSPSSSSSIGEGIFRAFAKIFEIYSGITKTEYNEKVKNLSPPEAISYLEIKYLDIEFLFGANIGIRKADVFAIEDIILDKEGGDYLDDFGKMILKLFPTSEMGHYYLGKYYESGKDFKRALQQYRLGYGKMNPRDPNADLFYQNVERLMNKTN